MDGSSLGSDYQSFCNVFESVERAMDVVVNDYHQAFNTAIQKFSSVVDTISESQKRVKDIKENLDQSKDTLECKRFDFLHLWVKSIQFKEMSRILDLIVELQSTQEKLETLVQEQHYLHAVRVLMSAEKIIYSNDLADIEALSNMREKLAKTKTYLQETLTSELQNHIYLKNKSAMTRIGMAVPEVSKLSADMAGSPVSDMIRFAKSTPLHDDVDADAANVDINSYNQIQILMEGLFHLGKLPDALTYLKERITIDIYHIIDRVLAEIDHLYCKDESDLFAETEDVADEHSIFHIFLTTLYKRLQAVMDGHIFTLDCALQLLDLSGDSGPNIGEFENSRSMASMASAVTNETGEQSIPQKEPFELYTKRDIAVSIQNEVKALLYDYLTNADSTGNAGIPVLAITEMLKEGKKGVKRQLKQLFHFKVTPAEEVKKAFMMACPALDLSSAGRPKAANENDKSIEMFGAVDRFTNVIESGHKLLISSNASNILIAYKPTLDFMFSIERKIGMRLANFKMYLEDFIFNVYLPQIQEQVLVYFHENVNGIDSFQADRYPDAPFPLIKSALCLVLEINGICRTLKCMPAHSIELVKFVEFTTKKFYEKCGARFRVLLSPEEATSTENANEEEQVPIEDTSVLSVQWAVDADLVEFFSKNTYTGSKMIDVVENQVLSAKETVLELKMKGERSFHRSELLLDPRKIQHLSHLVYGMKWMLDQIKFLGDVRQTSDSSASYIASNSKDLMRAFSNLSEESLLNIQFEADTNIDLPLNQEMTESFNNIVQDFQNLIQHILYSIRIEIRCHTIFYLDLAIREGNYFSDEDHHEPDPYIGLLNTDLTLMEEMISESLPPRDARFLFDGITQLMSAILINNVRHLRQVNTNGVNRLLSNILALQQNLISFTSLYEKDLEKAKKYFNLLKLNGPEIMIFIEKNPGLFTYEEYKILLDLVYNECSSLPKLEGKETQFLLKEYFVHHRF